MPPIEVSLFDKQRQFIAALEDPMVEQIAYGGSRGGGKSYVLRVGLVMRCLQYPGSRHLLLRRTLVDVVNQHEPELRKLLQQWRVPFRYNQSKRIFALPGASELQLGFAERVRHAEKYQGIEYLTIAFDEATQFEEQVYDRIGGSARVAVERGPKIKKLLTCNPGGIGHSFIKRRFVMSETRDPFTVWIPARLSDNLVLAERDPQYGERLTRGLPDWMKRQWLDGDWDASEGQYFQLPPGAIRDITPPYWARWYAGVDWGYFPSAFAVVWLATWKDVEGRHHCHVARELKRIKLNLHEQAEEALAMEQGLPVPPKIRYADPATGKRLEGDTDENGRTVASVWAHYGFKTFPARRHGRVPGWMLLREMMAMHPGLDHGVLTIAPQCRALLAEINEATFETRSGVISGDDIHSSNEDHLMDSLRYAVVMVYGLDFAQDLRSAYIPRTPTARA